MIGSIYAYNIVATMFGNGGASVYPGEWGDLLQPSLMRQSFGYSLFGLGSAVATLMMIAVMILVIIWYRIFRQSLLSPSAK